MGKVYAIQSRHTLAKGDILLADRASLIKDR
ncbi:hypothetical protein M892_25030 [Vibrio campbellii ATCC BAA-1116]|nr:hypothetical protein M892_25030 [Vibrio campbellii ATCC BAA-1116]